MLIDKSVKKILGIGIVAAIVAINIPAQAANWINIGSDELFEYYVDLDGESSSGNIWTAPVKATVSDLDIAQGRLSINCSNGTFKLQLNDSTSGWQALGNEDTEFAAQICGKTFPNTYRDRAQQNLNQRPIINRSQNGSVVVGERCSYVSAGGYSFRSCD